MSRLVVVRSQVPTPWLSCRTIGEGLHSAYSLLHDFEVEEFVIHPGFTDGDYAGAIRRLAQMDPDQISLIDHFPHPSTFVRAFLKHWPNRQKPTLNIHVFGDFVLFGRFWLSIEKLLIGQRVRWICASPRHRELLTRLLAGKESLFLCPFPVDTNLFQPRLKDRARERKKLGVSKDETVLIYSGRISLQKNLCLLIDGFVKALESSKKPAMLLIVGRTDERGAIYFGVQQKLGDYDEQIRRSLKRAGPLASKIRFLDYRTQDELAALANAADTFISLSTYHDEDYGMAPLEALCTGADAILTRWGGFEGFQVSKRSKGLFRKKSVRLVPVNIDNEGLFVDEKALLSAFRSSFLEKKSATVRRERAREFRAQFSAGAISKFELSNCLAAPAEKFRGFSSLMKSTIPKGRFNLAEPSIFFQRPLRGSVYHSLYGAYFEDL